MDILMKSEVVILAGGFGTRLTEVVDDVPKPMAEIGNRPFLTYILEQLCTYNFKKVLMAVGYKHEVIVEYFGKFYKSLEIEYVVEHKPLGTGGAILNTVKQISTPSFLVLNGDSIFKIDLTDFEKKFIKSESPLTIALKRMKDFNRYGTVITKGNRIVKFKEKEQCNDGLINGGIYMISNDWFMNHSPGKTFSFEKDILEKYISVDIIEGIEYDGYFIDIGVPEDYRRACLELPDEER
jgi:D-glycero-alpha-D-manno-heptose 1-phosphate guanylyltransferase